MALVSSATGRVEGPGLDDETEAAALAERAAAEVPAPGSEDAPGKLQLHEKAGHRATNKLDTSASMAASSRGAKSAAAAAARSGGFKQTFGSTKVRKRVNLNTLARGAGSIAELAAVAASKGTSYRGEKDGYRARAEAKGVVDFDAVVSAAGILEEKAPQTEQEKAQADDEEELLAGGSGLSRRARTETFVRESVYDKGQSKRIWGELFKVLDCSDVVVQVLDARNPMGTRSRRLEAHLKKEARHKHVVLVLNKCDLVPVWVTRRWVATLSREFPTLAFHASAGVPFGMGALIQLLQQYTRLHSDKPQVSVGFVGYPNVGKSSVINALAKKKVCNVAPVPGETKVWQYITLFRRTFLIDCPGVVPYSDDSETDIVLKGVTRAERLPDPEAHIAAIIDRCEARHLTATYGVEGWRNSVEFLIMIARKRGQLRKGAEPDTALVAKAVINDWQRGKLPWYTRPPGTDAEAAAAATAKEASGMEVEVEEASTSASASGSSSSSSSSSAAAVGSAAPSHDEATSLARASRRGLTAAAGGAKTTPEQPEQDWHRLRVATAWKGATDPDAEAGGGGKGKGTDADAGEDDEAVGSGKRGRAKSKPRRGRTAVAAALAAVPKAVFGSAEAEAAEAAKLAADSAPSSKRAHTAKGKKDKQSRKAAFNAADFDDLDW
jgi:ribosome biogenesis GTPase A